MKTNIGNKVKGWADHLEKLQNESPMDMLGRTYPDTFISEQEQETKKSWI